MIFLDHLQCAIDSFHFFFFLFNAQRKQEESSIVQKYQSVKSDSNSLINLEKVISGEALALYTQQPPWRILFPLLSPQSLLPKTTTTTARLDGCFVKVGQCLILSPTWTQTAKKRALRCSPSTNALLPLLNVEDEELKSLKWGRTL